MRQKYFVLLLLGVLFALPGIVAYLVYHHPHWLGNGMTNKGQLLNPPIAFSALEPNNKWRLLVWVPETCARPCQDQLHQLAKLRLALGRHLYDVEHCLLLGSDSTDLPNSVKKSLREKDIQLQKLGQQKADMANLLVRDDQIYLQNPQGYLVLAYPMNAELDDIYHDIKQLLHTRG